MEEFFQLLLHADERIIDIVDQYGTLTYIILFSLIFVETGLVIVTFFPGDGLLFAAGMLATSGELDISTLLIILCMATFLGNTSNYFIGRYIGANYFGKEKARRNKYLSKAFAYFNKHEGKAVLLSRFFPFMRSFVPFVAGLSAMRFQSFNLANFFGAILWIPTYLLMGYWLGEIPFIRQYFGLILSALLLVVVISAFIALMRWMLNSSFKVD